ncbi:MULTISPECIES: phage tail tape measure protein [Pseudomonas]|uniref:phage tail tape measure protein n=1 Tax=Pseudomonas TaxID=286 RepID=UPI000A1F2899|nr:MULTISPECIES: phage tail tape measure protein [Pseudomonas]MCX4218044.1 phage tail tape measure protein [Pseudomonas sp. MCal1]UIN52353.1 phage tail tape measure protein [Pseudomonas kribbensis]
MAESKFALTYANESGNAASGLKLSDSLGKPLQDLNLTMALASADIRLLTQEQIKLRELLANQQSLFKVSAASPAASAEPKSKLKAEIEQRPPPKLMQPAMANETALVELNQLLKLSHDQLQAHSQSTLELASEKQISASGATNADLLQVQLAGARSGIADGAKGDQRANELKWFSHDAAINASAFRMDVKAAGEMLAAWRSSLKLDQYQSQDLADATTYLGNSGLDAKAADIGSVVQRSGESAIAAGLTPEQVAALAAALLNSGADKESASTALKGITSMLAKGGAVSTEQRTALAQLGLDPQSLSEGMRKDAPAVINSVLAALDKQPIQERAALTKTLFGENDTRVLELLKKPDDVKNAFSLVADKHKYATTELGAGEGAAAKSAEAFGNTSQGRWNALDASLTRLTTAFGMALAPLADGAAVVLTSLVNGVSAAAETFPALTAGLVLLSAAAMPFVGGALKSGVASVLDVVSTKLLRLASARLPSDIADAIGGDDNDGDSRESRKKGRGSRRRTPSAARSSGTASVTRKSSRLSGMTARVAPMLDDALTRFRMVGDVVKSAMPSRLSGAGAKVMSLAEGLGARLMPSVVKALPVIKVGAPLAIAHAAYTGLKGWREGDDKAVKGAAGELAGTAIGATIGTFIAPGIGTFIGGTLGGIAGSLLGQKLATPPEDKLAPPAQVAKDVSIAQTQMQASNPQYTYAPSVHVSGSELLSSEKVGTMLSQVLESHFTSQFVPGVAGNALSIRRDAALTDGVAQ